MTKVKIPKNILDKMKNYPAFYQKVWSACAKIPYGKTRTYKWLAKKIGSPNAARAVGQALKKNPFYPIIPCHRVIRTDGTMGGYSAKGGIKRKKQLINSEKKGSKRGQSQFLNRDRHHFLFRGSHTYWNKVYKKNGVCP